MGSTSLHMSILYFICGQVEPIALRGRGNVRILISIPVETVPHRDQLINACLVEDRGRGGVDRRWERIRPVGEIIPINVKFFTSRRQSDFQGARSDVNAAVGVVLFRVFVGSRLDFELLGCVCGVTSEWPSIKS